MPRLLRQAARRDRAAARQLLALLTFGCCGLRRFEDQRFYLLSLGMPADFIPDARQLGRLDLLLQAIESFTGENPRYIRTPSLRLLRPSGRPGLLTARASVALLCGVRGSSSRSTDLFPREPAVLQLLREEALEHVRAFTHGFEEHQGVQHVHGGDLGGQPIRDAVAVVIHGQSVRNTAGQLRVADELRLDRARNVRVPGPECVEGGGRGLGDGLVGVIYLLIMLRLIHDYQRKRWISDCQRMRW